MLSPSKMDSALPSAASSVAEDTSDAWGTSGKVELSALGNQAAGNHRLDCRVLTHFAALEALSYEWQQLHAATGRAEIFQDFRWLQAWWRTLGGRGRLFTPVAYRGRQLVAILPLVLEQRRLRFLGHSVSDYNHFLAH